MTASMATNRGTNITEAVKEYGNKLFVFIRKRVPTNVDAEDHCNMPGEIKHDIYNDIKGNKVEV